MQKFTNEFFHNIEEQFQFTQNIYGNFRKWIQFLLHRLPIKHIPEILRVQTSSQSIKWKHTRDSKFFFIICFKAKGVIVRFGIPL